MIVPRPGLSPRFSFIAGEGLSKRSDSGTISTCFGFRPRLFAQFRPCSKLKYFYCIKVHGVGHLLFQSIRTRKPHGIQIQTEVDVKVNTDLQIYVLVDTQIDKGEQTVDKGVREVRKGVSVGYRVTDHTDEGRQSMEKTKRILLPQDLGTGELYEFKGPSTLKSESDYFWKEMCVKTPWVIPSSSKFFYHHETTVKINKYFLQTSTGWILERTVTV